MQALKQPYEFLVRWTDAGSLGGAHVQHRYIVLGDDGAKIGETLGPAEPLTPDTALGFPLADLLTQVQIDALARIVELETQLAALRPAGE